jgi:hypothetical protein
MGCGIAICLPSDPTSLASPPWMSRRRSRISVSAFPELYVGLEDEFRICYTLHLPSVKVRLETTYRFAGVFHALNQRRARLCC